jgi:hypothetical protein
MKHNLNAEIKPWKEQVLTWKRNLTQSQNDKMGQTQVRLSYLDFGREWTVDEVLKYATVRIRETIQSSG